MGRAGDGLLIVKPIPGPFVVFTLEAWEDARPQGGQNHALGAGRAELAEHHFPTSTASCSSTARLVDDVKNISHVWMPRRCKRPLNGSGDDRVQSCVGP